MKHIALFLATVMVAFLGCGGDDPTTNTPDESGTPPIEGGSEGEGSPPVEPACKRTATCGDPVANPSDPESNPSPDDVENPPQPVADPCEQFPLVEGAEGKSATCGGTQDLCTMELPPQPDDVCGARCHPFFYKPAEELQWLDNHTFNYTDSAGTFTCTLID